MEEPQAWMSELPAALPLYPRCFQWQLGWVPWGSYSGKWREEFKILTRNTWTWKIWTASTDLHHPPHPHGTLRYSLLEMPLCVNSIFVFICRDGPRGFSLQSTLLIITIVLYIVTAPERW